MNYLDPKNDLTFKKVFGQHPKLLRSFLNAMLPLPNGSLIESLEYLPADLAPENPLMKYSIVDVRCKDNTGRQFIVEMQMHWTTGFMQRVLFNASKAYVRQLDKSYKYNALQPVYALSLINEIFEPQKDEYYHHYQIVNLEDTGKQLEGLEFVFIELPKFKAKNLTEKKLQVLWLRFLTEIDENTTDAPKDLLDSSEINEALENVKTSAFSKAELLAYDKYWDSIRTEITLQAGYYDKGLSKGEEIGIKKGEEIGIRKGEEITALRGLSMGMSEKDIAAMTDLSKKTLEKLKALVKKYGDKATNHLNEME